MQSPLVQVFSSGKREVWIMPGASDPGVDTVETGSRDVSHDAKEDDSLPDTRVPSPPLPQATVS